jgi:LemA protein
MVFLTVLGIAIALVLLTGLVCFNGLADRKQEIRVAWAGMDHELKQRYAVLSRLIAASGSVNPKPAQIDEIMTAKNQAAVAFDPKQLAVAETMLTQSVRSLPVTGDPQIDGVRRELATSETVIGQAIARYNDRVAGFNTMLESFPNNILRHVLGFGPETEFHAGESAFA